MPAPTGPSNSITRKLIRSLWKTNTGIWRRISEILSKSSRDRPEINLYRLNKLTKTDDIVVVPGKVLGAGTLDHPITIGSLMISQLALKKLTESKGKFMTIEEMMKKYKKGSNIKILI
ncbi:MAG: 50S ribosomal protein L18e [Candidatus Lokiarchaeota archaeon]|nr:50S ribosomal protein L18e [Candidatus Lokiarchaeota archaeon]